MTRQRQRARVGQQIPLAPFQAWCKEQIRIAAVRRGPFATFAPYGPVNELADRIGLHPRVLNRITRGVYAGHRDGRKGDIPTDTIGRHDVENALTRAGVDFYGVYPEFEHERDIELEMDQFCSECGEWVTPIKGRCPWDDTDLMEDIA